MTYLIGMTAEDAGVAGAVTMALVIVAVAVIAEAFGQRSDRRERDARRKTKREAWRAEYLVGDPVVEDTLRLGRAL